MSKNIPAKTFEMRPVEQLKDYHFFVDSYQRGYKWTAQQVLDLLQDIEEFPAETGGIYPLQPVVTKLTDRLRSTVDGQVYELIDGQQRITTIYLILQTTATYRNYFNITYATRQGSLEFLKLIGSLPAVQITDADLSMPEELEASIGKHWAAYIANGNAHFDNPDNYHFYVAWQVINLWFSNHKNDVFCQKLLRSTEVIWYEVADTEVSEQVFMNINSGKVSLNSSELIKALFLLSCKDDTNKEVSDLRQTDIAQEWDVIERALQDDEFWYFIWKRKPKKKRKDMAEPPARIDLLFDLITGKKDADDAFFSYRCYDKMWRNNQSLEWDKVKGLFQKLAEWFENRQLYHYIGFAVYAELATIREIIALSRGKTKDEFKALVAGIIATELQKKQGGDNVYDLDEITYDQHRAQAEVVLLLFNIESYLRSDVNFRFPFDRLNRQDWSIEHIHPQNPAEFTTCDELRIWAEDCIQLLDEQPSGQETMALTREHLQQLAALAGDGPIPVIAKNIAEQVIEVITELLDTHSLSNLALLDRNTNSSLGNLPFRKKREKVLQVERDSGLPDHSDDQRAFIPVCTKNAFLKYYTMDLVQMQYWGQIDRTDYLNAIKNTLKHYLN